MRIYLIGFMGSGKSTVGKKLAGLLQFGFIDLDKMIEAKYKTDIPFLFEKYDENAFRIMERKTLIGTDQFSRTVIATGGGTPCFSDNMEWMNNHGITVYLHMDPASLSIRLSNSKQPRPLLKAKSSTETADFIKAKLMEREPFYKQADIVVKGESIDLKELLKEIEHNHKNLKK